MILGLKFLWKLSRHTGLVTSTTPRDNSLVAELTNMQDKHINGHKDDLNKNGSCSSSQEGPGADLHKMGQEGKKCFNIYDRSQRAEQR